MADIQPFRALRYDLAHVGNLSQVVAPPYDVIDAEMQSDLYKAHPANVVRLILNRTEPGDELDEHYGRAADFLRNWTRQGVLKQDAQSSIYIYHQSFESHSVQISRRGLIARIKLEPFGDGRIFPHEQTHSKAKEDRLKLTRATQSNLSQIFALYEDANNEIQELLESGIEDNTPSQATDHLGVVHQLWSVSDPQVIAAAISLMGPKSLYIADGHHRYETALNYQAELNQQEELPADHPANYVSMFCVSMTDPGMIVLPTHRIWRGIPPIASSDLCNNLNEAFECETVTGGLGNAAGIWENIELENDQDQMAFFCAEDDTWVICRLKESGQQILADRLSDQSPVWRSLGVSILHELAMPLICDTSGMPAPKYVHSIDEFVAAVEAGDQAGRDATGQTGVEGRFELATLVMPATIDHVRQISENGERMPAKSTYFYPKLLSGLIINPLQR